MPQKKLIVVSHCALLITALASWSQNIGASLTLGLVLGLIYSLLLWLYARVLRPSELRFYQTLNLTSISFMVALAAIASFALWRQLFSEKLVLDLSWQMLSLLLCLGLGANAILIRRQALQLQMQQQSHEQVIQKMFAGPSLAISLALAVLFTLLVLLLLLNLAQDWPLAATLEIKMLDRGVIPPLSLLLFFWGLILLVGKYLADLQLLSEHARSDSVFSELQTAADSTEQQERMVGLLWQSNESFYSLPQYLNWAIPILGFIGTVLGISLAAESISGVISASQGALSDSLAQAIAPLGIAFDTTLIALSLSVVLVLLQTLLRRYEERQFVLLEKLITGELPTTKLATNT